MKIRTQILAVLVVFALITAAISVLMVTTNQELERLTRQGEIAGSIALEVGDLGYLSNDYILYREPRQAERWQVQYANISDLIGRLSVNRPEQHAIADNLALGLRNTRTVFEDIRSSPVPAGGTTTSSVQIFWSRMAVQNQGMIFDADRLGHLLQEEADALKQMRNLLIVALTGMFVALLLTSYLLFYRRTVESINSLQAGAAIVGSGDLTHVIDESAEDEIGDLARAFNRMTGSLNTVTASKADLEREVAERKQAEGALRESEKRLKALYSSMSEGLADHQVVYRDGKVVDYVITDVNPAFEQITGLPRIDVVGRKASELYGTGSPPYLDIYARAASGGSPEHFETYFTPMGQHFAISVFSPEPGRFATVFSDITERKQAEEQIRVAAERLEIAQRAAHAGFWDWDMPTGKLIWTDELYRLFGLAPEDTASFDRWLSIIHPDDREPAMAKITRAMEEKQFLVNEYRIRLPDGRERWIGAWGNTAYDDAGKPLRMSGVCLDITDRKRAEEALRESEIRYRTVADNTYDWEFWQDPEGRMIYCSPSCERITGHTAGEFLADPELSARLVHPEDRELFRDHQDGIERLQKLGRGQWRVVRPDGTQCWVDHVCQPVYGDRGEFLGRRGSNRDISEGKQALETLHETRQYLENLINYANAPIVVWDPELRITRFNKAFERMTGRTATEVVGRNLEILFPGETREASLSHIRRTMAGERWETVEIPILHRNGEVRAVLWNSATLYGPDGETVISAIAQGQDITERRQVEEALRESEERFRTIAETSPVHISVSDASDETLVFTNTAYEQAFGFERGELIGKRAPDLYCNPADRRAMIDTMKREGTVRDREVRVRRKDGTSFWIVASVAPIRFGGRDALLGASVDITTRKRAEVALHETSQYLENLITYANAPIIVWDPELRITRFNRAFERLTGWTAAEVMGRDLEILFPGKTREASLSHIRRTMAGERWETVEIPILHRSGEVRAVLWNSATLYEADGKTMVSAIAQGQDITERKRMEEEVALKAAELAAANVALRQEITQRIRAGESLRRTMSLLKATFESTADGILNIDAEGKVAGYNQNFVAMWNVPFALLQTPDEKAMVQHMAGQLADPERFLASTGDLADHPGRQSYDMLELRDGRIFERDTRPQRIGHDIVGRVWSYRDVTERKRAEERLLASLNEKEVLLREIHHRVKNNLQLISGLLDLTRLRTRDQGTLNVLTDMMLKIQTMAQIHTRLYESKQFDRINMRGQIRDQIVSLSQIYGQSDREILCETDLADLYLPIDQAIPCALAVNEILSNAYKHAFRGRDHGCIRVTASREDSRVRIAVRDDGTGIPGDFDIARSPSLGMKLIRNLVENQLKGTYTIRREGGTEVIIEFPVLTQEGSHVTDTDSGR